MCAISKIINNVVEYYFFRNRRPNKKESTRVRKKDLQFSLITLTNLTVFLQFLAHTIRKIRFINNM